MRNIYNENSDIVVLINEDCTGRKISKSRAKADDAESVAKVFQTFIDKYGLGLKIIRKGGWLDNQEFKF